MLDVDTITTIQSIVHFITDVVLCFFFTFISNWLVFQKRERKLKRKLWIARAKRAIEKIAWFKLWCASISTMNPEDGARQEYDKWKKNLGKFLKKAEENK